MKTLFLILTICFSFAFSSFSQTQIQGTELGIEGYASTSTLGGNLSLGLKYGFKLNENIIVGPSFRLMKSWSKSNGTNYSYSIYGGGAFLHARYGNMIFGGVEFEMINTPLNYGYYNGIKHFVPTLFIGGGFSREFKEIVRVNAGVFYDVINNMNSPFRTSYMMTKTNSTTGEISGYIPVIYRISFFFRITDKEKEEIEEEE